MRTPRKTLREAVTLLSPLARDAMRQAATRGLMRRGTWAGCAFNAASTQIGAAVNNQWSAADVFAMPPWDVSDFITAWDALQGTDEWCTTQLIECLDAVAGEPYEPSPPPNARSRDELVMIGDTMHWQHPRTPGTLVPFLGLSFADRSGDEREKLARLAATLLSGCPSEALPTRTVLFEDADSPLLV